MDKEFKTIEQQMELLESRGVATDSHTAKALQMDGYYSIINGYKDTFLDKIAMQNSPGDVYKAGTSFSNIYDLFIFDRRLKGIVLPYLIEAESIAKNAIVYSFCNRHREIDAYLERSNYVAGKDMLVPAGFRGNKQKERDKRLNTLIGIFTRKLTPGAQNRPFTSHYLEKYGKVPLWVLQNDLTFGNIEHFYQLQQRSIQNEACKIISSVSETENRIGCLELLRTLMVLVDYRNICAHDDRLYCANVRGACFDAMLEYLWMVITPEAHSSLCSGLVELAASFAGLIDPSALNAMYSNSDLIPIEFKAE